MLPAPTTNPNANLQYVLKSAYAGNTRVESYTDGVMTDYDIIDNSQVPGYVACLEKMGYAKAYDVSYYERKLKKIEFEAVMARESYAEALRHPLMTPPEKE